MKLLQANWIQPEEAEKWLRSMAIGRTLNICCGASMVGDVRLDVYAKSSRTEYGNLHSLNYPKRSFETVICDPPFSEYRRFKWILSLADIASKRLLLSGPTLAFSLGKTWKESLYALKGNMFLRLWYCFDRQDGYIA